MLRLRLDDDDEARRNRYYQFARPTRSCRLKHSQVCSPTMRINSSIIGDPSNCILTSRGVSPPRRERKMLLREGIGRKIKRDHNPDTEVEVVKDEKVEA